MNVIIINNLFSLIFAVSDMEKRLEQNAQTVAVGGARQSKYEPFKGTAIWVCCGC